MKKTILIISLLCFSFINAQNFSQKTKNIIKAKFIGAKDYFEESKYNEALQKIIEIEEITGKPIPLASALDLKVQILLALDKHEEAKKEIDIMMNLKLSNQLITNVSKYNKIIETNRYRIEAEREADKLKEKEKQEKIKLAKMNREEELAYYEGIEIVPFAIIEDVPVFPGCQGNKQELKDCFNQQIQKHFALNFDSDLPNNLGLSSGRKRVFIGFQIDHFGNVRNIQARAPHPKIKEEVIRTMKLLPKMTPGKQRGKSVGVKYNIPFTLIVE